MVLDWEETLFAAAVRFQESERLEFVRVRDQLSDTTVTIRRIDGRVGFVQSALLNRQLCFSYESRL